MKTLDFSSSQVHYKVCFRSFFAIMLSINSMLEYQDVQYYPNEFVRIYHEQPTPWYQVRSV